MAVRAVLLDLFDTAVDLVIENIPEFCVGGRTLRGTQPALQEVLARYVDVDLETLVAELRAIDAELRAPLYAAGRECSTIDRFEQLVERLGIAEPELPGELTETHMQGIRALTRFLPHHVPLFTWLHERVRIGICSNFSHTPTAYAILESAELLPHIDAVVISEEVGIRKPRREIFDAALDRLGVAAGESLHVGDQLDADVAGAADAGIRPVWITRRVADPERALRGYKGPAPQYVIADLGELREILEHGSA